MKTLPEPVILPSSQAGLRCPAGFCTSHLPALGDLLQEASPASITRLLLVLHSCPCPSPTLTYTPNCKHVEGRAIFIQVVFL